MEEIKLENLKYYKVRSKDKRFFEVVYQYNYKGRKIKYFIFVERKEKLKDQDYFKEAEKIFNQDLKDGKVKHYSDHYYPKTISKGASIAIITTCAVLALGAAAIFTYKMLESDHNQLIRFDAEGGTLELYDSKAVGFPCKDNLTWKDFYTDNHYFGANKDGYDFICWSLDGENPIPNDYVLDKPVVIKPIYKVNDDALTFACRYSDNFIYHYFYVEPNTIPADLVYSINGDSYAPYDRFVELGYLKVGDYVSFKRTANTLESIKFKTENYENSDAKFSVSGKIDVLTHGQDYADSMFYESFTGCKTLCSARGLNLGGHPLTENCFGHMFSADDALFYAPELPATTLAKNCYEEMFKQCNALIQAPSAIPASEIPSGACNSMFRDCGNLLNAPNLSSVKRVHKNGCESMFRECGSLINASDFNPDVIAETSCAYMFFNCSALENAPTTLSANKHFDTDGETIVDGLCDLCYTYMFNGCSSLVASPRIGATIIPSAGASTSAPLNQMFADCSNLSAITIDYLGNFEDNKFNNWVNKVSSKGTFYYNGNDITHFNPSAIPEGWEIKLF